MYLTLANFQKHYPNNRACLDQILQQRSRPCECGRHKWYYLSGTAYVCACGKRLYPLVGTIFENSSTPLTLWFYVIFVMTITKSGVSAAQMQRELGVTYKCAWRMMHKVRELMKEETQLCGTVEADETFMRAKPWRNTRVSNSQRAFFGSPKILGIVDRGSGQARVRVVPNLRRETIHKAFKDLVTEGSTVVTDGSHLYVGLRERYSHQRHVHYGPNGQTGFTFLPIKGESTQRVENLWSNLKRGIRGTHIHVSKQHLQKYADEFAFRYSHRGSQVPVFEVLVGRV